MSVVEKPSSISSSVRETDPLLKDLNEKKQGFRKNVVSLAAELKEARNRLASQEQSFAKETVTRQVDDFWFWFLFVCFFEFFRFNHCFLSFCGPFDCGVIRGFVYFLESINQWLCVFNRKQCFCVCFDF
jgi:hypothetical protein